MKGVLHRIEDNEDLNDVRVGGLSFWPYLRQVIHSFHVAKAQSFSTIHSSSKFRKLRYLGYGLHCLFRRDWQYVIATDACLKKELNGLYVDKSFDTLLDVLGEKNTWIIEFLTDQHPRHYPKHTLKKQHISSYTFFQTLAMLISWIPSKKEKWRELRSVLKKYETDIPIDYLAKNFISQYRIMTLFFKVWKPKVLFVTCYFGKMPLIIAAKEVGIPVVEIQHGAFEKEGVFYTSSYPLDTRGLPDYLWTFGENEKKFFDTHKTLMSPHSVSAIGNAYLEKVEEAFKADPFILHRLSCFKTIVAISGQDEGLEAKLIPILEEVLSLDDSLCFIYVPRRNYINNKKKVYNFSSSSLVCLDLSIYEAICYSDFHTSIYSTCALEAPALGVRNILIDCDGIASAFFKGSLENSDITTYVKTAEEYLGVLNKWGPIDKNTIKEGHRDHCAGPHLDKLKEALEAVLNVDI